MADDDLKAHEAKYLAATNGTRTADDAPVVILAVRPQSFRHRTITISRSQAVRLAEDFHTLPSRSATRLLVLALIGLTGCSSKVEVERETTTSPDTPQTITERSRTAVAVDLTGDQEPAKTLSRDLIVSPHDANSVIVDGSPTFTDR